MSRRRSGAPAALLRAAVLLFATGCGVPATHLDPADDATWTTLNDRARREPAKVLLAGSETFVPAAGLRFAPDTTRWRDGAGAAHAAPTPEVLRISFHSRRMGAHKAALGGVMIGLPITTFLVAVLSSDPEVSGDGGGVLLLGLLAPIVLGGAGGLLGAATGADEEIVLGEPPPPDTRYLPGSGAPAPDYVKERRGE